MYDVSQILALRDLVGFEQDYTTTLDDNLLTSDSGLIFQNGHPMLTINNLLAISPQVTGKPTWDSTTTFSVNDIVYENMVFWKAKVAQSGNRPSDDDGTNWEVDNGAYYNFSNWLSDIVDSTIIKSVQRVLTEKVREGSARSVVSYRQVLDSMRTEPVDNDSKRVGFMVEPIKYDGVVVTLKKVCLHFTEAQTITLQLYHTSKDAMVDSKELVYSTANTAQWFSLDWDLPYYDGDTFGGGWYVTYKQSSTSGNALSKVFQWGNEPCTCDRHAHNSWQMLDPYVEFHPFFVDESDTIWDYDDVDFNYSCDYGLNFSMSVNCDYTQFILDHEDVFKDVIQYQFAVDMLKKMIYNPNTNINRNDMMMDKDEMRHDIYGQAVLGVYQPKGQKKSGLKYELDDMYEGVKLDMESMGSVCRPCKRRGVKYKVA